MNLYEKIINPFVSDEIIKKLVQIFSEKSVNDSFYSKMICDVNDKNFNREKYIEQFENLIVEPTLNETYKNLKDRIKNSKEILAIDEKVLKKVLDECKTFNDLKRKIDCFAKSKEEREKLSKLPYSVMDGVKEFGNIDQQENYNDILSFLSYDKIQEIAPYIITEVKLKNLMKDNSYTMGFHVNPEKMLNPSLKKVKNEVKFYINAGDDTCKVASLFKEKCEKNNLNYYFKVANPYKNEEKRSDKLCIYSTIKDVDMYYNILNEIKKENPEILFREPPLLSGKIDGWIGIASDFERKNEKTSYNKKMSIICENAIKSIYKDVSKNNSIIVEQENIEDIKNKIMNMIQEIGYSQDKACIDKKYERILKRGGRISFIEKLRGIFLKSKALPEAIIENVEIKKVDSFKEQIKFIPINKSKSYVKKSENQIPSMQIGFHSDEDKEQK